MTDLTYTDIDINLAKQKNGDVQLLGGLNAIKANLNNVVKTMKGSRRMQPNFCYGPSNFLFEPITQSTAINIGNSLYASISQHENRIDITNIDVQGNLQSNTYNVTISYKLKGTGAAGIVYTLSFILKKI